MSDGVSEHDKVLLLCSKNPLERPGLLNELERVFERASGMLSNVKLSGEHDL